MVALASSVEITWRGSMDSFYLGQEGSEISNLWGGHGRPALRWRRVCPGRWRFYPISSLNFVRSERNLVDPLTKPLSKKVVSQTSRGMGLMSMLDVNSGGNPTLVVTQPMLMEIP
ncbi:hypothetical protein Acr_06g0011790 [Actinidia rufa]|uniref:Uncharacterized protein n=1 Tax=Actinidia rufa TaxID=165716 RepID=A0A7J0ETB8_9ERIC|nr:hypothetical protein Acr_06g0011790 [Actinidia rufa]